MTVEYLKRGHAAACELAAKFDNLVPGSGRGRGRSGSHHSASLPAVHGLPAADLVLPDDKGSEKPGFIGISNFNSVKGET